MSDHYVRHILSSGDYIRTEFKCEAPFGAKCRMICDRCNRLQREQCECGWDDDLTPDLQDQGECMWVVWLDNDESFELYNGEDQPVRGPDWQPIEPEWNGEGYEWDYAT